MSKKRYVAGLCIVVSCLLSNVSGTAVGFPNDLMEVKDVSFHCIDSSSWERESSSGFAGGAPSAIWDSALYSSAIANCSSSGSTSGTTRSPGYASTDVTPGLESPDIYTFTTVKQEVDQTLSIDMTAISNLVVLYAWVEWEVTETRYTHGSFTASNTFLVSQEVPPNGISEVNRTFSLDWPTYTDPGWMYFGGGDQIHWEIGDATVKAAVATKALRPDSIDPDPTKSKTDDPINTISGNVTYDTTDIFVPAPGIPLAFSRHYGSLNESDNGVGHRWRHSYDWSISETNSILYEYDETNGVIPKVTNAWKVVTAPTGSKYSFKSTTNGYEASFDVDWELADAAGKGYELTVPPSTTYGFASNGVLTGIEDAWGNEVSLTYTNASELLRIEHANGQGLDFAYANGNIHIVTSPNTNLFMTFLYSPDGDLTNATRTVSNETQVTSYRYDDGTNHWLTSRINPIGDDYTYSYETNGSGRGISMDLNTNWYTHAVDYVDGWNKTTVTYSRGDSDQVFNYEFNPINQRVTGIDGPGKELEMSHDTDGNVATQRVTDTVSGDYSETVTEYDGNHNPTNISFGYNTSAANTVVMRWHPDYQLPTNIVDAEGHEVSVEYTNGLPSAIKIHDDSVVHETTISYLTNGLLSAMTNANGNWVRYQYDGNGNPTSAVPKEGPAIYATYSALGHLEKIETLPYGFVLDPPSGSPPYTPSDEGEWQLRTTTFERDELGRLLKKTYPNALYETFKYDSLGNLTNHVDIGGRTTGFTWLPSRKLQSVTASYQGSNVTLSSFQYDRQFNALTIKDALDRPVESYILDGQNRPTTVTNVEEQVMTVTYGVGGRVKAVNRFDSSAVNISYNGQGLLSSTIFSDATNSYSYLKNGLMETAVNARGTVSNSFNDANRLTSSEGVAPSGTVSYAYYPAGQVSNSISVAGTTTYDLDDADRVATITSPDDTLAYGYSTNNGLAESLSFSNSGVTASFEFDSLDRISGLVWKNSSTQTIYSLAYEYTSAGNIYSVTKANGEETIYEYDELDRLTKETQKDTFGLIDRSVSIQYDLVGNRTSMTRDGISLDYTRGDGNRLASWSVTTTNIQFTVDVTGHANETIGTGERYGQLWVSNIVETIPDTDGTNFWAYGLPVGMGTQEVEAAICDEAGNTVLTTNAIFITAVTNGAYGYDPAGCVTSTVYTGEQYTHTRHLSWNAQYQLVSVSTNSSTVESYAYDALGQRVQTVSDGTTNWYVYDGAHVAAEVDADGDLLKSYTWGPGIDNLLAFTVYGSSTNTYNCLTDHLGSVHALVDSDGHIVESYRYDAWGRVLGVYNQDGEEIGETAIGNHYLWQGRWYSWETGLYFFRARWYDPVAGRWLSKDPIGISGGLNQYVFCGNNPVNFIDPWGLCKDGGIGFWERLWYGPYGRVGADEYIAQIAEGMADRGFWQQMSDALRFGVGGQTPETPYQEAMQSVGELGLMAGMMTISVPPGLDKYGRAKHLLQTSGRNVVPQQTISGNKAVERTIMSIDKALKPTSDIVQAESRGGFIMRFIEKLLSGPNP